MKLANQNFFLLENQLRGQIKEMNPVDQDRNQLGNHLEYQLQEQLWNQIMCRLSNQLWNQLHNQLKK